MQFIQSIYVSESRDKPKRDVVEARLKENYGFWLPYDFHSGKDAPLPVSFLYKEDIEEFLAEHGINTRKFEPAAFCNDITINNMDLERRLQVGDKVQIGEEKGPILSIVQVGKPTSEDITIDGITYKGLHLMPLKGIYAKVEKDGIIRFADEIKVI